jgi:hypothetical protein
MLIAMTKDVLMAIVPTLPSYMKPVTCSRKLGEA